MSFIPSHLRHVKEITPQVLSFNGYRLHGGAWWDNARKNASMTACIFDRGEPRFYNLDSGRDVATVLGLCNAF